MTKTAQTEEKLLAMNEALMLGAVRQHELTEASDSLNARLQKEIIERKRAEVLLNVQREALQLLAEGAPLREVLEFLTDVVERNAPDGLLASLVPLNEAGTHFQRGIGASLPEAFNAALEGVEANSPTGLCAYAVKWREPIAVRDFGNEPRWQAFGEFVAAFGLQSGWSTPILASGERVLGTFASYYRRVGDPTPPNRELVDVAVRIAALAIERKRADEAHARLAAIVQSSDDAIVSKDLNGVITSWNAGAERLFGYTAQEAIGQSVTMLIPRERLEEEPGILERIRRRESVEHYETVRCRKDGTSFDVSLTVSPIVDSLGNVVGASKIARDITERKQAEEALRESEERYRDLFASAPMAAFACDRNAVIQRYNQRAAELWGREPVCGVEQYSGSVKLWFPNGTPLPHAQSPIVEVLRTGIPALDVEVYIERPDGSRLPVLANFAALKNAQGEITGAITSFMDITERKQAEQRQRLLMNELAHRGRNLLAVIQSIAARTLSGTRSMAEARESLSSRIQALARSQTVLMNDGFEYAPLVEIIRLEVEAFSDRVSAGGPDVMLKPKFAQTFALLVHELATNATKHGALSQVTGRVSIRWTIDDAAAEPEFCFQWQERGGPPAKPPTREGFGRMLLEKVVAQDFGAPPSMSFAREGFSYEIRTPLSVVVARSAGDQQFFSVETAQRDFPRELAKLR